MDQNLKPFYKPLPPQTKRVRTGLIRPSDLCLSINGDWIRHDSSVWLSKADLAEDAILVARRIEDLTSIEQIYGIA